MLDGGGIKPGTAALCDPSLATHFPQVVDLHSGSAHVSLLVQRHHLTAVTNGKEHGT